MEQLVESRALRRVVLISVFNVDTRWELCYGVLILVCSDFDWVGGGVGECESLTGNKTEKKRGSTKLF